ncbi:MAG: matrixin family metalloprotease [Cytophagales bacterium]|nr:matrixin family metalloprotease [Cytophagales bacterium]
MKKHVLLGAIAIFSATTFFSCQREETPVAQEQPEAISEQTLGRIYQLGFGTKNVVRIPEGYLVEGDILITEKMLGEVAQQKLLRVGEEEQYRTTNLVNAGAGRTITVSISNRLPASYVAALDVAIARYNAENLSIRFQRVSSGANISIVKGAGSYLASAGFPTSAGDPHNQIKVNSAYLGNNPGANYLGSILAHELGHCIGFRHTDYMDRSYSCNGSYANEGASTIGAIHIPGTPTVADPNSWMLACIGTGDDRPFNANDKTALNYLY